MLARMTPAQSKAARQLLGWTSRDLAREAGVSPTTVLSFERGAPSVRDRTIREIKEALIAAGIEFRGEPGPGEGKYVGIEIDDGTIVRLRKRS